jgi:EF hand
MSKLATLTGLALLLTAGYAFAQETPNTMTSGRPSAVLTPDQCNEVWSKAVPKGDTLAQADAAPYIVNFAQVDTDNDGTIDKKEFVAACGKGLVKYTSH